MGFSFQVFPSRPAKPDPGEVCARATALLRGLLTRLPIGQMVRLSDELLEQAELRLSRAAAAATIAPELDARGELVGFAVRPGAGKGEVRPYELDGWTWYEPEASRIQARGLTPRWERVRAIGCRLEVSRLFAEPALSAIAHGFVAASLAEATDGILFTADGAWDGALLPCAAQQFVDIFMRPEHTTGERFRRYAVDKLRSLPDELQVFEAGFGESVLQQIASRLVCEMNEIRGDLEAELAVLERAISQIETARVLTGGGRELERRVLVGSQLGSSQAGSASAFARLHPTPAEYERWLGHIGEMMP